LLCPPGLYHVGFRGRYQDKSRHPTSAPKSTFMTHSVISRPSIAALRKVYSITSLASARRFDGMLRPSAFAVVRLMTSSNLVGCSIGMSAGFVPRRILSTKSAPRLHGNRDALEDTGLLFLRGADVFLIEDRHVTKKDASTIYHQQFDQGQALALEVAIREANLCIGAYQFCQAQYPKVCSSKLP
jgi:hypothetical protein